ncbi:uncharacterized protein BT62DRAFT_1005346 [Guyanagaster necrorhizus]|uniref:Uncharacterized protein n=1 Tax=Guyanagaster necrorhizus TaxID=856835 RepID=A0A9P7VUH0_9AGAR|nr:uncharacterized protein BT62DRAFT_1005346 [Guyanagaster necrorhizus MCA 3950]KAG7446950.1 hypothetical protein BT62DRAFT_1005346 [Guyanagaster necrorhizus MCA 3950]
MANFATRSFFMSNEGAVDGVVIQPGGSTKDIKESEKLKFSKPGKYVVEVNGVVVFSVDYHSGKLTVNDGTSASSDAAFIVSAKMPDMKAGGLVLTSLNNGLVDAMLGDHAG